MKSEHRLLVSSLMHRESGNCDSENIGSPSLNVRKGDMRFSLNEIIVFQIREIDIDKQLWLIRTGTTGLGKPEL